MKRFFTFLLVAVGCMITANAENFDFRITHMSQRLYDDDNNKFKEWTEWEESEGLSINIYGDTRNKIVISAPDEDVVTLYIKGTPVDSSNDKGKTVTFKCKDNEGDECEARLRKLNDGSLQFYIDYEKGNLAFAIKKK